MLIGIDASRATLGRRTGTENYSLYLTRALLREGHEHRFRLYFNCPPEPGLFPQGELVEWRIMPFPRLWTHIRLAWEVARRPPDVLFVPAHVLPLRHPECCVATVHDLGYLYYPQAHTRLARWYLSWSTRFNVRQSTRVIVDSEATRRDLLTFYHTDPARIVRAYPAGTEGLRPVRDRMQLARVRERYHTGQRYFLYLGTLQPRKNIGTLVRAFARLVDSGMIAADVRLVLAGKRGWLYEEISAGLGSPEMRDRIVLPGYVETEDLAALLSGAIAYVLPSRYEGFGLPVLEAMACDTPVICSNVASLPEVAGDAALLFAPDDVQELADQMHRLYDDSELRDRMIALGRQRVRRFSWRRCARQVLGALADAAKETGSVH